MVAIIYPRVDKSGAMNKTGIYTIPRSSLIKRTRKLKIEQYKLLKKRVELT